MSIETQADLDRAVADAHAHGLHIAVIPTVDGPALVTATTQYDIEFARRIYKNALLIAAERAAQSTPDGDAA
jgi:hypothetical protein